MFMTVITLMEKIESFTRVSRFLEYLLDKLNVPNLKPMVIGWVWEHKDLCLEIDREVKKIWLESLNQKKKLTNT